MGQVSLNNGYNGYVAGNPTLNYKTATMSDLCRKDHFTIYGY